MSTPKELNVTAAGAYEHVLNDLAPLFTRAAGVAVRMTVANAAGVIARIEAKEPADVVLTSVAGVAHLVAVGLADSKTQTEIGRVGLGIATRPDLPPPGLETRMPCARRWCRPRAWRSSTPKVAVLPGR